MTNYAYLTEGKDCTVMHIVNKREIAERSRETGKVIETGIPERGGHALLFYDGEERTIIVYSDTEMRDTAKGKAIEDSR